MKNTSIPVDLKVFNYKLPGGTPDGYSKAALHILKKLEEVNRECLQYFLAANTVLTLSGVRAFDTYVTFEKLSAHEIAQVTELLASKGITLFPHLSEYDDRDKDMYSLVHHEALSKIPEQYGFSGWIQPNAPFDFDRMIAWSYTVESKLFQAMQEGKLPKEWLNHHWSAHDIRFGILLGYPGEAIASCCWEEVIHQKTGEELSAKTAEITYHDAYDAAQPTYFYMVQLKDNPNIKHHQELWSYILTRVYESTWHQNLKAKD
jgi:hypothetical protein